MPKADQTLSEMIDVADDISHLYSSKFEVKKKFK